MFHMLETLLPATVKCNVNLIRTSNEALTGGNIVPSYPSTVTYLFHIIFRSSAWLGTLKIFSKKKKKQKPSTTFTS